MKQIYKAGGVRKTESGVEYTIRAVSDADRAILLGKGWVSTIEEIELKAEEPKAEEVKAEEVKSPFNLEKPESETKKKTKGKQ